MMEKSPQLQKLNGMKGMHPHLPAMETSTHISTLRLTTKVVSFHLITAGLT